MKPRLLLDNVKGPGDIQTLSVDQLSQLAAEIRDELLDVVAANGGHLASNLGIVELTLALLNTFDLENDRIVWDTGHQAYVYKLLTARRELFQSLRQDDGCCGFLHREESPYDCFGAGHAGTAISAAIGFAVARDQNQTKGKVVALVGDGAMGSGISFEGLNSIIEATEDFVLVLNDNRMSIAPNVGALAKSLSRLISGQSYNRVKDFTSRQVGRIPFLGPHLRRLVRRLEAATKGMLVPGLFFEELGLRYIGPIDGHNLHELIQTFQNVRKLRQPIVIHVLTQKGRGYPFAEQYPEHFHGLSRFDRSSGIGVNEPKPGCDSSTFSHVLGTKLCEILARDDKAVAITAGMCEGTGLGPVREAFPERFFDVGIAEEHAVVFAAGLAAAGLHPVVAVYATFMQRAMDYVFHDVCLQHLPVVFCLDRAGVVTDGPTHHGINDLGFWRTMPNLEIAHPADGWELGQMLDCLVGGDHPALIRYPKASAADLPDYQRPPVEPGKAACLRTGGDVAIWCLGHECHTGLQVASALDALGISATIVNPRFLLPFDTRLLQQLASAMPVVALEDHCITGGLGSLLAEELVNQPHHGLFCCGWPRTVIPWGTPTGIRNKFDMTASQLADTIATWLPASDTPAPTTRRMDTMYSDKRRQVAAFMRRLYRQKLTTTSGGNLSMRVADEHVLLTASKYDKAHLTGDQVALLHLDGRNLTPDRSPSIEYDMHLEIYRRLPEVRAIVHAHPVTASAFCASGTTLDTRFLAEAYAIVGIPAWAPYATMGTRELAESVADAATRGTVVMMENHGVVATGGSLLEAFDRLEITEIAAQTTCLLHQLGNAHPIPQAQLLELDDIMGRRCNCPAAHSSTDGTDRLHSDACRASDA